MVIPPHGMRIFSQLLGPNDPKNFTGNTCSSLRIIRRFLVDGTPTFWHEFTPSIRAANHHGIDEQRRAVGRDGWKRWTGLVSTTRARVSVSASGRGTVAATRWTFTSVAQLVRASATSTSPTKSTKAEHAQAQRKRLVGGLANLANLVQWHTPCRTLRSASANLLSVTRCNISFGARSFRSAAPAIWNSLPSDVCSCETLTTFRRHLKSHLFHSAFATA